MVPLTAPLFGGHFFKGHISLKKIGPIAPS
jgi:hypothetical protein